MQQTAMETQTPDPGPWFYFGDFVTASAPPLCPPILATWDRVEMMMFIKKSKIKPFHITRFSVILSVVFKIRPIFATLSQDKHHFGWRCGVAAEKSARDVQSPRDYPQLHINLAWWHVTVHPDSRRLRLKDRGQPRLHETSILG